LTAVSDSVQVGTPNAVHIILELANRENNGRDSAKDIDSPNQQFTLRTVSILEKKRSVWVITY